jgi:hypothetical protein
VDRDGSDESDRRVNKLGASVAYIAYVATGRGKMGITFSEMAEKWVSERLSLTHTPPAATEATKATEGVNVREAAGSTEVTIDPFGLGLWLLRCVPDPKWQTAITALHADFCRWRAEVEIPAATEAAFAQMLLEVGYPVRDGFALGLALEIDWLSQQRFEHPIPASVAAMPAKRRGDARRGRTQ